VVAHKGADVNTNSKSRNKVKKLHTGFIRVISPYSNEVDVAEIEYLKRSDQESWR
jgi:maleate cis-trans isomerase